MALRHEYYDEETGKWMLLLSNGLRLEFWCRAAAEGWIKRAKSDGLLEAVR